MPGPLLFARYAYPPNALGYCGPGDSAGFLGLASEGVDLRGLSRLAAQFEGAWPYLQLIAGCNGIAEPLDLGVAQPPPLDAADSSMDECLLDHLKEGDDERQQSLSRVVLFEVKHRRPRPPDTRLAVWPQASR